MRPFMILLALVPGLTIAQSDSTVLPIGTVLNLVRYNHPIAKQAGIAAREGEAYLQYARGAFDPKVYFSAANKYFNGKNYYSVSESGIKLPTWFGMELSAGWEKNEGAFLNPEETTPPQGLNAVGLSMPLLRNLLTDERRTQLRKAQLMKERTQVMRDQILNELTSEVVQDYVRWYYAWMEAGLYRNAVELLDVRMKAIRAEFTAGARSAADTIETGAQLAQFRVNLQEAVLSEQKARLGFSTHLWSENGVPVDLSPVMKPTQSGLDFLDSLTMSNPDTLVLENIARTQPELNAMSIYVDELALERRYRQQLLLPDLSVKYNLLSPAWYDFGSNTGSPVNNYTFGINFSSSLFLRKERGEFQLAHYKWQGAGFKLMQKNLEVARKVKALYAQVNTYQSVSRDFEKVVSGYEVLYENEKTRFSAGDATVFMVNTRETKLLESRLKLLSYREKLFISRVVYLEESGIMGQAIR